MTVVSPLRRLLVRGLVVAAGALLAGALLGAAAGWAVATALLAVSLYLEYAGFAALYRWASQPRLGDLPDRDGAWGDAFHLLHKHRRQALRRRRELARLILRTRRSVEALPYGVALLDGENRIEWCNATARDHLGIDAARDRGQRVANLVRHPEFADYLAGRAFSGAVVLREGAGTAARTLRVQLVAVDEGERLLLSNDITGEERVAAMRRDFVANASHELRTPLTVLSGFLQTIRDLSLERERVKDYLALMAPQAERMERIIEDLLALSSIENAPLPLPERVSVPHVIDLVAGQARTLSAGRHEIAVRVEGEHDLVGSETEIASAFANLSTNAVRYTPEGGRIELAWRSGEHGAAFAVADTGIGIAPEHLPRLTERFYRVDRSHSRETGGTGLGLAIVKHVLARHHAALSVRSEPGRGSVFAAEFPPSQLLPRERAARAEAA